MTERMAGRDAASLIASASLRPFLVRLTKGLTYYGGIRRIAMAQCVQQAPQMMGATGRLQYHLNCLLFAEESFNLAALEFSPQHRAFLLIDTVKREHVLGRIDRDALELH
jgi:hypothetical protein